MLKPRHPPPCIEASLRAHSGDLEASGEDGSPSTAATRIRGGRGGRSRGRGALTRTATPVVAVPKKRKKAATVARVKRATTVSYDDEDESTETDAKQKKDVSATRSWCQCREDTCISPLLSDACGYERIHPHSM